MSLLREERDEQYVSALSSKYTVLPVEKYPDAIINLIINRAYKKYVGNKNVKQKMLGKVAIYVQDKIRSLYGKYAILQLFEEKNKELSYHTNLHLIFKVKDENHTLGLLYGNQARGLCNGILFTEHSLQRFEERALPSLYESEKVRTKRDINREPTPLDIMTFVLSTKPIDEFGRYEDLYYLNLHIGILVLEKVGELYIAKTFLTPDMLNTPVKWYQLIDDAFDSLHSFFTSKYEEIESPKSLEKSDLKEHIRIFEILKDENIKKLRELDSKSGKNKYVQDIEDLENNFKKFKQYVFHPELVNTKELFQEYRDLSYRFRKGPIKYYLLANNNLMPS